MEPAAAWVNVARVTNLAEAGFLSDELMGLGIETRVYQMNELGGATHQWSTAYLIQVSPVLAHEAAAQIRRYMADESIDEEPVFDAFGLTAADRPADPVYWRPVAMIVLAGVASFALGRQSAVPESQRRPARDSLATAIESIGRPLVSEPTDVEPRHRLSYDRQSKTWSLDTDRNADGVYESRRKFHAAAASW
jgi:hypothetical protein